MKIQNIILGILLYFIIEKFIPVDPVKVLPSLAKDKINNLKYHYVIDVRPAKHRNTGYHVYSMSIPLEEIDNITKKIKNKNRKILVISNSINMTKIAANKLSHLGYRNIEYLNSNWTSLI